MKRRYIHIILLSLMWIKVFSQVNDHAGTPFIHNFAPDIYNSQPQNWAIVQDHRGILYFGNGPEIGVLEYDGKNWRIINVSNHSTARSLEIDSLGTIYVGASGEFGFLASDSTGALIYKSLTQHIPAEEKEFNNVLKIHATSHGIYFITTNKIFRWFNNQIVVIKGEFEQRFGFNINDNLFVGDAKNGIMLLRNNQLEALPYTKPIIENCGRFVVLEYPDNKLLIATVNNGLFLYNLNMISHKGEIFSDNTKANTSYKIVEKLNSDISRYLKENSLYTAVKINDFAYAFGTLQGGVIIMDNNGKLVKVINKNRGLINNTVLSLFVDKIKNLWIGTYNGISYAEISSPLSRFNELNGLYGTPISLIKHKEKRFIGTTQGIFLMPEYKLRYVDDNFNLKPISNYDTECWAMFSLGKSLLSTGSDGVYLVNDVQAKRIIKTSEIYCFGSNEKFPHYLFLGLEDGIAYIKNRGNIFDPASRADFLKLEKLPEINFKIRKIITDSLNNLWLTTEYSGLIYIQYQSNKIDDYKIFYYDTAQGLPQLKYNWVFNVDGHIVIASGPGFYKPIFNKQNQIIRFTPDAIFGESFATAEAQILELHFLNEDQVIIHERNSGIGIISDLSGEKKRNSDYFKKLKEPKQIFYDKEKVLWISTLNDGLFCFNESIKKNYREKFNTLLRKVIVGKDSIVFKGSFYDASNKTDDLYSRIVLKQQEGQFPVFSYQYNSIKFQISSTNYEFPEANQYSWMLEGFDKEWSDWGIKTEENYKKIREGEYTLKIKSKNVFGTESNITSYKFIILPPWHRTIWAYLTYLILIVLFLWLIVRLNSRRLKAANVRLEKMVKERTKEIRKQRDQISEQKQAITDSIQYAKRIQSAVLPPVEYLNNSLPEHFILFKPRDIVSGDFYWMKQIDNYVIFTAADCTGHGVPGAFMSMLGVALLNEIVRRKEITHANQILDELRHQIKDALRQSGKEGEAKDGMDLALCILDLEKMKLQYSGAYNPLYIVRNKELIEYKADKMPIGIHVKFEPFANNDIELKKGDVIYIFSDGFVDQFGGPKGKKFMIKPFKRLLTEISDREMEDQKNILDISITEWRGEREQIDDIVVFGVRV